MQYIYMIFFKYIWIFNPKMFDILHNHIGFHDFVT